MRDNDDRTILHLAQSKRAENINNERNNKYGAIIEYLAQTAPDLITMSAKYMGTPLHYAARHDFLDQLKFFLQQKNVFENIDTRDEGGNGATPLQRAILNYKPRAAQLLVENGANVTAWMWGPEHYYIIFLVSPSTFLLILFKLYFIKRMLT